MAYGLKKIAPIDLKPSKAVGIAIPFSAPNVFTPVYTTKDQTKYNLINFLLTNPRERLYNPSFGAGIRAKLFQQIETTTFEEIQQSLISQIESYFPQLEIIKLQVSGKPDENSINIYLSYTLRRSKDVDYVSVTVQNT